MTASLLLVLAALVVSSLGATTLVYKPEAKPLGALLIGVALCLCIEAGRHLP